MFDIIISFLTITLLLLCLFSKDRVVNLYGLLTAIYNIVSPFIPNEMGMLYYLTAAINDLIIIGILSVSYKQSKNVLALQDISKIFILINFIGWILYESRHTPEVYFTTSCLTYLYLINLIVRYGEQDYVGIDGLFSRLARVPSYYFKRTFYM